MKAVIGLGCSWTQGEGGYPDPVYKKYGGRVNLPMHESMDLIPIELANSWVKVLSTQLGYESINLGQRGIGNRASAKSLYLADIDWDSLEDGIVVFMLTGFERFDFFREDWRRKEHCGTHEYKSNCGHYNFQTLWPNPDANQQMKVYAEKLYSEEGAAAETVCAILDVQTFCKAHNLKFVIANAFDGRAKEFLVEQTGTLADKIDWSCYIHETRPYESFVELLVKKDGDFNDTNWRDYYGYYQSQKWPKKYLANCVHPTIEGYKVIASELKNFIKERYNV